METSYTLPPHGRDSISSLDGALSVSSPSPPLIFHEDLQQSSPVGEEEDEAEVSLMPTADVASGCSMTSTLVNLLVS